MSGPVNMASVAADLTRRSSATRWSVEATVHSNQKNIFAFSGEHGAYHVGTLVSGSKSKLDRFDADARLIAAAPELYGRVEASSLALEEAVKLLDGHGLSGCASIMRGYIDANAAALAKARGETL